MRFLKFRIRTIPFLVLACAATSLVVHAQDSSNDQRVSMADKTIHAQPSYVLSSNQVELAVTLLGGHMAPVTFYRDKS